MIKQNGDFISDCECCGKDDLIASQIILKCNYGSKYDGEILTLNICDDCADEIYDLIKKGKRGI